MAAWPVDLFIGLGSAPVGTLAWDSAPATPAWDSATDLWDEIPATARIDATCDFQGLEIRSGSPTPEGRMESAEVNLTLANALGQWSQYDASGTLISFGPGTPVDIWVQFRADGSLWWLFSGRAAAWRENVAAGTVEVQAFDALAGLNIDQGEWDPGTYADTVTQRLVKILDRISSTAPRRFDTGRVTLHSYLTTATPLEEIQNVAASDGGIFFADADGTLVYRARDWVGGRTDQTAVRIFSDNVCDDTIATVWDPELATDDDLMANVVTLTSLADVKVTATDADSVSRYGALSLPGRPPDQWITQAHGQELADLIVARRADGYLRIDTFTLYLHDPRQPLLWSYGIDLRLGDLIRFPHDQPTYFGPARIDLNLIVHSIVHEITPTSWVTTFGTTRALGNNVIYSWDDPTVSWDSAPAASWGP